MLKFPKEFLWGAAASAPQTEGHSLMNGKSATTWDKWFEMSPEKFNDNQGPSNTSNTYEMYREDVANMKKIGLNSYRTSISWARLLPDGQNLNQEAVDFYRAYFQAMLDNGIKPIINLFHFDMPWWLMEKGGWENRESVDAFGFYAKTAFEQFGDLITEWTTFNEPMVHVECGYLYKFHYPEVVDMKRAVQVGYNTLMAHVMAVNEFRNSGINGRIGIILNVLPAYSRSDDHADLQAKKASDLINTQSFLDPAVLGKVPEELIELFKQNNLLPTTELEDAKLIKFNTVDFIGINYYQPRRVQAPTNPKIPAEMPEDLYEPYDWPDKEINPYRGWEIYPRALFDIAMMMKDKYHNIPWYVSENGMGVADEARFKDDSGMIDDQYRIDFIKEHLEQLHRGIEAGSNCFGYHMWTYIDCWSWLNGYRNRYGFYSVDLDDNYKRTVKKSGLWFKELTKNNGFELEK
ncbi:glycoside hydrolase family 1 protein [Companilactobacillus heilongjiangensis]|uniref:6-phospho-beta-glucosidase n=1 Tax=Companilactobacillus heilongjiangensis TaxID=1074467 RepID=A0A0K2LB65_9LACO|nr:glycoside hydrolase family 1 protein [Companilactobacillus heilongjiangensis]ALB28534.1 6-phospho-beta-glucosidase [Companilactobacillus heilongjiangensis]